MLADFGLSTEEIDSHDFGCGEFKVSLLQSRPPHRR